MKKLVNVILSLTGDDSYDAGEQPEAARIAGEVAKQLGKEVESATQHKFNLAINEPLYPFTIPMDSERFRASVRVAESFYAFEIKHRKGEGAFLEDALFCVSFKSKDRVMFTKDRVRNVSKELGVAVYRQGFIDDETVARFLLCDPVRAVLARIDFTPLTRLLLSPIQLEVTSKLKDSAACAVHVRVFMELMEALACARKPEKAQRKRKC